MYVDLNIQTAFNVKKRIIFCSLRECQRHLFSVSESYLLYQSDSVKATVCRNGENLLVYM